VVQGVGPGFKLQYRKKKNQKKPNKKKTHLDFAMEVGA
jgi:hypothetical protein